jgi:hypothetical protein
VKNRLALLIVPVAAIALFVGLAGTAHAFPTRTAACSTCHGGPGASVSVGATQLSNNGTTASYSVSVSGGNGVKGWAVFQGATNRANATAATGTFSVPVGATYRVWGVDSLTLSNFVDISPVAPAPIPVPVPVPTPVPTPTPVPVPVPTPVPVPVPVPVPSPVPTVTPAPSDEPSGTVSPGVLTISSHVVSARRGTIVLSGALTPAAGGERLVLSVRKPHSRRWTVVSASITTAADGTWSYTFRARLRGTYQFRIAFAGSDSHTAASGTLRATVRMATRSHH